MKEVTNTLNYTILSKEIHFVDYFNIYFYPMKQLGVPLILLAIFNLITIVYQLRSC